jgi:D-alanyl-D-alanine carboxypeptidase
MRLSLPCRFRVVSVLLALAVLAGGVTMAADSAEAAKRKPQPRRVVKMPSSPTDPAKDAALVIDGVTGKVLYARNETAERFPASLTKMMTLYLLFDALKAGKVTMQTPLPVSRHASIQKPTKLSLRPGQTISVDMAIRALVIRSANDVAVVIAEALGGTESHFARMMTEKARSLGMRSTNFHNASGLPDMLQITTATDMATLGRRLAYDHPQYYPYFALPGFTWKGTYYKTHDNLIDRYDGADGIKTGYTNASGFNLVSSVTRNGMHVVAVVMGGRTAVRRDLEMIRLLDQTFAQIQTNPSLVARATLPWQQVARSTPTPASAGFSLPAVSGTQGAQFAALSAMPGAAEDEDSAEARIAPDEKFSIIHAEKPAPAVTAQPAAIAPLQAVAKAGPVPSIRPTARPDFVTAGAPIRMAAIADAPRPKMRPSVREETGEGDADPVAVPGRNWTIQIGAYADKALASAQLDTYAGKAQDVLGRASRIVSAVQSPAGNTIYRARFGLFGEQEARDVCNRLTQRGQTCFAAVQAR